MADSNRPLVSVITCCYNSERFLRSTIESVAGQTLQDFEYIFVNNASTDGTVAIFEEYTARDPARYRLLHQMERGLMLSRNCGLRAARGKYICFVDGDDLWLPDKLAK